MATSPAEAAAPRVLIVEDDSSLRRLIEMRLSVDGYETRSAGDGAAALEVLATWLPDVVVTDVMMPRLSGLSLCRQMRDAPRTAAVPVILLTACCFDEGIQEVVDLGGVTFMNKPFDARALDSALRDALDGHAAPAAAGAADSAV